jgi:hypothetical protein
VGIVGSTGAGGGAGQVYVEYSGTFAGSSDPGATAVKR